jgi:hypothetical protein
MDPMKAWHAWILVAVLVCPAAAPLHGASETKELRKPAPDASAQPYRDRLEMLIRSRYPKLITEKVSGTAVVTVLLEIDGQVATTRLDISPEPLKELTASESQFARLGVSVGELRYIGISQVDLPLNTVLVVFGARNSRDLDRALVERFFSSVLTEGLPEGEEMWILFDHEGQVLASGQELVSSDLTSVLEARYPGIRIGSVVANTVYARDGHPLKGAEHESLQLNCVWLAADSPLPHHK